MTALLPRIGLVTYPAFAAMDARATVEAAARMGYRSIELTSEVLGLTAPDSVVELTAVVQKARRAGAPVHALGALVDPISGDSDQRTARIGTMRRAIELAAEAGVPMLSVYAGPDTWDPAAPAIPGDLSRDEAWARLWAAFDPLLAQAERAGVLLAFKPVIGTLAFDTASTHAVLARYGCARHFGITLDPSHFALRRETLSEVVASFGPRICNVHLKDAFGKPGVEGTDFYFPPLGTGIVDWKMLFDALDAIGYGGPMHVLNECQPYLANVCSGQSIQAADRQRADLIAVLESLGRA